MQEQKVNQRTLKLCAISLAGVLGLFLVACDREMRTDEISSVPREKNETIELIGQLADPDGSIRGRAYKELQRYIVVETDAPEFSERLTRFHKHAPHACKAENEAQTLSILNLFEAQQDITSVLVTQCLGSKHATVRAKALGLAYLSDNSISETLLAFDPDPKTAAAYTVALMKLGTPEALERIAELLE